MDLSGPSSFGTEVRKVDVYHFQKVIIITPETSPTSPGIRHLVTTIILTLDGHISSPYSNGIIAGEIDNHGGCTNSYADANNVIDEEMNLLSIDVVGHGIVPSIPSKQ